MAVTHGMNITEVESLGRLLQQRGDRLAGMVGEIETALHSASWDGPDARRFRDEWWPGHRSRIAALGEQIRGFGQSALNNASEQRATSGEVSGAAPMRAHTRQSGIAAASTGAVSGYGGQHFTDGNAWVDDWQRGRVAGMDQWNFGYDGDGDAAYGNCTSFVAWRLNQLGEAAGHDGYRFTNNDLDMGNGRTTHFGRLGNAYEWWDNAGAEYRASTPTVGSVLVWEQADGMGDYGHVAVVKDVRPDGSIVIEESAWDKYTYRERVLGPGTYPPKFLNFLP